MHPDLPALDQQYINALFQFGSSCGTSPPQGVSVPTTTLLSEDAAHIIRSKQQGQRQKPLQLEQPATVVEEAQRLAGPE